MIDAIILLLALLLIMIFSYEAGKYRAEKDQMIKKNSMLDIIEKRDQESRQILIRANKILERNLQIVKSFDPSHNRCEQGEKFD